MIRHIVLVKLRETISGDDRAVTTESIREKILGLNTVIPQIKSLSFGVNLIETGFHICMDSVFENSADLKAYLVHPAHREAASYIQQVSDDLTAFDYEM